MSSLTNAFKKANGTVLAALGLGGFTGYTFLFNGMTTSGSVIGGFGEFYGAIVDALPGAADGVGFFLSEAFNLTADVLVPGLGTAMSAITHAL